MTIPKSSVAVVQRAIKGTKQAIDIRRRDMQEKSNEK